MISAGSVFVCVAAPLCAAMFFTDGKARRFCCFFTIGLLVCFLAAYINSYLLIVTGYSVRESVVCVTPISEELIKLLPILFYFTVFEPDDSDLMMSAVAVGAGFATFENCCYLIDADSAGLADMMVRGFAVGIMHIVCTLAVALILVMFGRSRRMMPAVVIGVLAAAVTFHALYNMLVSVHGVPRAIGYGMPVVVMAAALENVRSRSS